jgi:hypothetical protein
MRHQDFERIKKEFENYYCKGVSPCPKGEYEYYQWLNALRLDENLCYGQTHESFQWAKNMLSLIKEDADNKYYKVLVAFPIKSMNSNVYKERDLIAAAMTLKGCCPSINHKDEFWLSKQNPVNKWGTATVEGAQYEDGAVEVILKVPKTTKCPVCSNDEKLYQLIDSKKIVNVSLEGMSTNQEGGFRFNEKGFTLLTSNVLPGIPLARIFPIEAYLPTVLSPQFHKRTIKVIGMTETTQANQCPPGSHPAPDGKCVPDDDKNVNGEAIDSMTGSDPNAPLPGSHPMTVQRAGTQSQGGCTTMPDCIGDKTIIGESIPQLKVQLLKTTRLNEDLNRQLTEQNTLYTAKLEDAYTTVNTQRGTIKTLESQVGRLETQVSTINSEKVTFATETKTFSRNLEDMTESRDQYKKQCEELKTAKETLETKYREQLKTNLALEKRLTETNEEYLTQAKKTEQLEEGLKKAHRVAKIITKI